MTAIRKFLDFLYAASGGEDPVVLLVASCDVTVYPEGKYYGNC